MIGCLHAKGVSLTIVSNTRTLPLPAVEVGRRLRWPGAANLCAHTPPSLPHTTTQPSPQPTNLPNPILTHPHMSTKAPDWERPATVRGRPQVHPAPAQSAQRCTSGGARAPNKPTCTRVSPTDSDAGQLVRQGLSSGIICPFCNRKLAKSIAKGDLWVVIVSQFRDGVNVDESPVCDRS